MFGYPRTRHRRRWNARARANWYRRRQFEGQRAPFAGEWIIPVGPWIIRDLRVVGFTWSQARAAQYGEGDVVCVHDGRITRRFAIREVVMASHEGRRLR